MAELLSWTPKNVRAVYAVCYDLANDTLFFDALNKKTGKTHRMNMTPFGPAQDNKTLLGRPAIPDTALQIIFQFLTLLNGGIAFSLVEQRGNILYYRRDDCR